MTKKNIKKWIKIWMISTSFIVLCALLICLGYYIWSEKKVADEQLLSQRINEWVESYKKNQEKIRAEKLKKQRQEEAKLEAQKKQAQNEAVQNSNTEIIIDSLKDHIRWNKDAQITLVEYSDFECPFCKRFHPTALKIFEDYKWKVNWVYRHFPLWFHNPLATKQAEWAECVAEVAWNDAFWKFVDLVYETTTSNWRWMKIEKLTDLAEQSWSDRSKFQQCLDSGKYNSYVIEQMKNWAKAWVRWTPWSFIINNKTWKSVSVSGAQPFANFKKIIDWML